MDAAVGSKRLDAVPASAPEPSDELAKRPRHTREDEVHVSLLHCDGGAGAGDDAVEDADAIRFLRTNSVTWQQESEGECAAGWRLCVHPFLGSGVPLPTCFRLLRALAALLAEEPRPLSLFHCCTQPFFESLAAFSVDDCATALEITEYAQLPKVLHGRIVDFAVVSALGQVLRTPDPEEGPSWHEQCHFNTSTVGSLERAVAALVPDRLATIALACSEPQPVADPVTDPADASSRPQPPAGSDAQLLARRALRGINARAFESLAQLRAFGCSPHEHCDSQYRAGLWGQPHWLEAAPTPACAPGELPADRSAAADRRIPPWQYRAFLLGRVLSGRPIPPGRDAYCWYDTPESALPVAAAARGQVDTLQLLRLRGMPFTADAFAAAARAGCVDSMALLWNGNCPITESACAAAAGTGNLPMLQWLRAKSCPWDENVCISAVRAGHLAVAQWAAAAGCPCGEKALNAAIAARRVDAIRWLCIDRNVGSPKQRARILEEALRHCDVAMLTLAHELDVPFTELSLDVALKSRRTHGLRSLRAATAVGYDLLKAGLATAAAEHGDRQLLRLAHAWGAEPDPGVLTIAVGTDDLAFVQEVAAMGHPLSADAAEGAAAAGAFRALEWLLAEGCQKRPLLYGALALCSGWHKPDYMDPPSESQRREGPRRKAYQHARFHAKQLQLMQSLYAEGVPLPSDGQLWRAFVIVPDIATPKDVYHPALPWLLSIGYPFPTSLVDSAHDVGEALKAGQYGLLRLLRDIKYPAAEGAHLWRAAVAGDATDAIRFLLSEKYPLPEPPGTLFAATEFDAFAVVAEHATPDVACERIAMLAAAGYPPSRTAMGHAARRGNFPLAKALRQAQCLLTPDDFLSAWGGDHVALMNWIRWQLRSGGPQAVAYTAEADTRVFGDEDEEVEDEAEGAEDEEGDGEEESDGGGLAEGPEEAVEGSGEKPGNEGSG